MDRNTLTLIGSFRNNWRERNVFIYDHPTDPDKVVTFGEPFAGGPPISCTEPRQDLQRYIGKFGTVVN